MMTFRKTPTAAALCLLAASALTTHAAVAQTVVNSGLTKPTIDKFGINPDTSVWPAGTFSFNAQFCNNSTLGDIHDLASLTMRLDNGNQLVDFLRGAAVLGGVGSLLATAPDPTVRNSTLAPNECIDVLYVIGLQNTNRFGFFVDMLEGAMDFPTGGDTKNVCGNPNAGSIQLLDGGSGGGTELYQLNANDDVRITGTEPAPLQYETPVRFPVGCGEPHEIIVPRYTAPVGSTLRVFYECDCT
jgi:hypothetical protein